MIENVEKGGGEADRVNDENCGGNALRKAFLTKNAENGTHFA